MAVGFPLYQEEADSIAQTLRELADAISQESDTFSLNESEGSDGTRYLDLDIEADAGMFALTIEARAFAANIRKD